MVSHRSYNPGPAMPLAGDPAHVSRAKLRDGAAEDAKHGTPASMLDAVLGLRNPSAEYSHSVIIGHKRMDGTVLASPCVVYHFETVEECIAFHNFLEKTSAIWASQNPANVVTFPHGRPGFAVNNDTVKGEF